MNDQNEIPVASNAYPNPEILSVAPEVPLGLEQAEKTMEVNQQTAMLNTANADQSFTVGLVNPLNGAVEIPEDSEEEDFEAEKSPADTELEHRNRSGLRFIVIFGLLILIFIIMLPFIVTII